MFDSAAFVVATIGWDVNPFDRAAFVAAAIGWKMGLLQPPPQQQNRRFDDQSERDLLITLAVQMDNLRRTVTALVWAVGLMMAGIVPFTLILALYGAALWMLWKVGP